MNSFARLLSLCIALACAASAGPPSNAEASCATAQPPRAAALRAGDRLSERTYEDDRIDWKLPHKRLERFRAAGVIINEERRIASVADAVVVTVGSSGAVLRVSSHVSSFDVPRDQLTALSSVFNVALAPDNQPRSGEHLSVADASMVGLPAMVLHDAHVGQRWRTRVPVETTLGSGQATFDHEIVGIDNGLAEISVRGAGSITGEEYHLPKLLPGSIELNGTAWYDARIGLVTLESYAIHNRLLKPAEGEQIGFDERLTVDVTTRLIPRAQGPG